MRNTFRYVLLLAFVLQLCQLDAFGQVDAKKITKKRRKFDLQHVLSELKDFKAESDAKPVKDDLNCDEAIDQLLLNLPDMGSVYYALLNGWYLGQWADYATCLVAAADSQYILATVKGTFPGQIQFSRGGIGKYTNGFNTRIGLCFPK